MECKEEQLKAHLKKKKECDEKAQKIILRLIETGVERSYLLENAIHLAPKHFEDIVEERKLGGICGWVLCDNKLDPKMVNRKQKYSIMGHQVLDISLRKAFCCATCFSKSMQFSKQLLVSPLWLRDKEKEASETCFTIPDDETELHGICVNITGMKIYDKDSDDENNQEKGD